MDEQIDDIDENQACKSTSKPKQDSRSILSNFSI